MWIFWWFHHFSLALSLTGTNANPLWLLTYNSFHSLRCLRTFLLRPPCASRPSGGKDFKISLQISLPMVCTQASGTLTHSLPKETRGMQSGPAGTSPLLCHHSSQDFRFLLGINNPLCLPSSRDKQQAVHMATLKPLVTYQTVLSIIHLLFNLFLNLHDFFCRLGVGGHL